MIAEMIVVEGKEDTVAVRRAVEADTIETGGSAINEAVLRRIELAYERRGVIVFTDPDVPGEKIRKIVAERVPGCKHAFLTRDEARGKDGLGVEHAKPDAIRKALERVRSAEPPAAAAADAEIAWSDLIDAGLIVHAEAASRRERMGELLGIGYANGKQFHKRCVMFRITRTEFAEALEQLEREGATS
ncbi:ribonuclease M5 [Cohnella nanjingensis]|uniref:Ribonuclease M5 n=1 Tax=Cohnella nanjingensis TaxID=1387779 RepID=A0A7X0RYN8_9BACL|nr:ribonuclease M5 [Cohnella nanjingensis]MBB6674896.1 ribonuclease M5 [Cohnella nanjingensis]